MRKTEKVLKPKMPAAEQAQGQCACGAVEVEIDVPARWAWHDHSPASRLAQGCAYATYVGSYRSRFRILNGEDSIARYEDPDARTVRGFCTRCGTPIYYERPRAPTMVNIPRALFTSRTGREPRYHLGLADAADWAYQGEPLAPLKGFPGVMWSRPRRRRPWP
jgi:hypothetical protein